MSHRPPLPPSSSLNPASSIDSARALAHASPAGLAYVASGGKWLPARHLLLIADRLCALARGELERLMVFMPPRAGKSQLISEYTPAWFLGTHPDKRVMLASYGAALASEWGRKSRNVLEEWGPTLYGVDLRSDSKAADRWDLAGRSGGMVTAGVGGPLTGKGGHLIIIDDPLKDAEEAASETIRAKHIDWWRSTVRTRLMPGGAVVLLQTRWHEEDLAGWLLADMASGGDQWEVLSLPALAEPDEETGELDDPLGRQEGEALWPEMFDEDNLAQTRRALGAYYWTAMYQQKPRPAEGLLFKSRDFRYFDVQPPSEQWPQGLYLLEDDDGLHPVDPRACTHFQTADTAASEKEMADYTVVSTWAVTPVDRKLLLVHVERGKFEDTRAKSMVEGQFKATHDPQGVPRQRPAFVSVENAGPSGPKIIKHLRGQGIPVRDANPDTDKVTRALTAVALYEGHQVYHRRSAAWRPEWEREHLGFPNTAHDDQVDTTSMAAIELPRIAGASVKPRGGTGTRLGGAKSKQL